MNGKSLILVIVFLSILNLPYLSAREYETLTDPLNVFESYLEVWTTGHTHQLNDVVTEDFALHTYGQRSFSGRPLTIAVKSYYKTYGSATDYSLQDIIIRDDWMWLTVSESLPIVDEPQLWQTLARFENGKLAEVWRAHDALLMLEILEALPKG